ncbi:mcf, partial [Candidatus Regiella insecticola 5.15]
TVSATLPFEATFHIPLGDRFDEVKAALLLAQAKGVMTLAQLDDSTKSLHLGYRYQELNQLAAGHPQASLVVAQLKEVVNAARGGDLVQSVEEVMLDKFADKQFLRQWQGARLTQVERIYHSSRAVDFDTWDRQYSAQAGDTLNQQLSALPSNDVSGQLTLLLENRQGLLISETHGSDLNGQRLVIEQMKVLKDQGVMTIGLEHLRRELAQPLIDDYLRTGIMSGDLRAMLNSRPEKLTIEGAERPALMYLFEQARENGMKIVALDDSSTVRPASAHGLIYRVGTANNVAVDALRALPAGEKFVAICGQAHLQSHQGTDRFLPGITQRLGLPALQVNAANQLTVMADDLSQRTLFMLLDRISEGRQQQAQQDPRSPWYVMTPAESLTWKEQVQQRLEEFRQTTLNVLAAEHLQMSYNPRTLDERVADLKYALTQLKEETEQKGFTEAREGYRQQLENTLRIYQQQQESRGTYEQHWATIRTDLQAGGIRENSTIKLAGLDEKIAEYEKRVAGLDFCQPKTEHAIRQLKRDMELFEKMQQELNKEAESLLSDFWKSNDYEGKTVGLIIDNSQQKENVAFLQRQASKSQKALLIRYQQRLSSALAVLPEVTTTTESPLRQLLTQVEQVISGFEAVEQQDRILQGLSQQLDATPQDAPLALEEQYYQAKQKKNALVQKLASSSDVFSLMRQAEDKLRAQYRQSSVIVNVVVAQDVKY